MPVFINTYLQYRFVFSSVFGKNISSLFHMISNFHNKLEKSNVGFINISLKIIILATSKEVLVTPHESSSEETEGQSKYLNIQLLFNLC